MTSTEGDSLSSSERRRQTARIGVAFGIGAWPYTWTNILLRRAAGPTDLGWNCWATCLKAVPSAIAAWTLIILRWSHGQRGLDGWKSFAWLTLNGFFMQFGGNISFQYAMSFGGLCLPFRCASARSSSRGLGGRLFLKEKIGQRTMIAMWLLITAVIVLSQGADAAASNMNKDATFADMMKAIVFSGVSGLGYGFGGVSIRRAVTGTGTIASTIAPLATIGIVGPGLIAWNEMGPSGLAAVDWQMNATLLLAGTFNAIGFFFAAAAMARLPLVRVNLINASQIAMCALGGVLFYGEPATWWYRTRKRAHHPQPQHPRHPGSPLPRRRHRSHHGRRTTSAPRIIRPRRGHRASVSALCRPSDA